MAKNDADRHFDDREQKAAKKIAVNIVANQVLKSREALQRAGGYRRLTAQEAATAYEPALDAQGRPR